MPRGPRPHGEGYWYHVFSRGGRRRDIFLDDADRELFLRLLGSISRRFGVEVHAWCLLDNHYHLVVHAPQGNLGAAMHYLGTIYAQRFNDRHGYDGKLCRGRFESRIIGTDEQLLGTIRYVTANAVRHGLVASVHEHRWNSLRGYLAEQKTWLVTATALSLMGDDRTRFRRFVEAYEPPSRAPSVEDVENAVSAAANRPIHDVLTTKRGELRPERDALFLLLTCESGLLPSEVGHRYGLEPSTVRSALARARTRLDTVDDLRAFYDTVSAALERDKGRRGPSPASHGQSSRDSTPR